MTEGPAIDFESRVACYVLGLMDAREREAFAREIAQDEAAHRQVVAIEAMLLQVGAGVTAARPPAALRERLMDRVRNTPVEPAPARIELSPGVLLVFGERLDWQDTPIPGVRVKPLHIDPARRYASSLVSMAQGAVYPPHVHGDVEELFMVSGAVRISGHRMQPGDYCRADAGTLHDEVIAETDCVFIVLASQHNRMVSGADPR